MAATDDTLAVQDPALRLTGPVPARTARKATAPRSKVPTLREERRLLRDGARLVAGIDEVGRGALAGPVTVGVVVVTETTRSAPQGLRDSKLLTPAAREALAPRLRRWATSWAVGSAEPDEIDAHGILAALRLAGMRALAQLPELPDAVLLDGSYDWLTRPPVPLSLFDDLDGHGTPDVELADGCVRTLVKGDLRCAAVAAASVLAKTARDAVMCERDVVYPGYGWAGNKGYSAPEHLDALGALGPCEQHRRSWRLPGVGAAGPLAAEPGAARPEAVADQDSLLDALEALGGPGETGGGSPGDMAAECADERAREGMMGS